MMGQFKTPETIKTVVNWMRDNQLLIPAFQRDYVWKHNQVQNLFDSLMRGYPISSMLFWKVVGSARSSYQYYEFLRYYIEHYHTHNEPLVGCEHKESFMAVLDGQQRLTSLYLGLCGTYAYHTRYQSWDNSEKSFPKRKLYLNLSAMNGDKLSANYDEERIYQFEFFQKAECNNFADIVDKDGHKWFLVGRVLDIDSLLDFTTDNKLNKTEANTLEQLWKQVCVKPIINYYEEDTVSADQAVNIFIRINAGGTYLSQSDILMSILRAGWKRDARADIQALIDSVACEDFYIGNDYIIKALLYLKSKNIQNLIQNFDNSFLSQTELEWDKIAECIKVLFCLLKRYQLNNSTLLSYNATLPILYYMYYRTDYKNFATGTKYTYDRQRIKVWLTKTLLLKSFGSQSDSILVNARKAMTENPDIIVFPSNIISKNIGQPSVVTPEEVDNLLDVQKENRLAFLILALLFPNYGDIAVDKDHMHPISSYDAYKNMVGDNALSYWQFNSIVNLQFLTSNDNKSKGDMPLSKWVKDYSSHCSYNLYLQSYIPNGVDLELKNFNEFYEKRKLLLAEKLKEQLALGRIADDYSKRQKILSIPNKCED